MSEWELVKDRTASAGAVWRSADGQYFKRTGGSEVAEESGHQSLLSELGFPVPQPTQSGTDGTLNYFIEPSVGQRTLHELALEQGRASNGRVSDALVDRATEISAKLLQAQARSPLPTNEVSLRRWFSDAGFTGVVFAENPDLDTLFVRSLIDQAVDRLSEVPMCHSHLDYGLPNVFDETVIDWQHHAPAPLGYDVYPMLDIAAFKGGGRGYAFSPEQRLRYVSALDEVAKSLSGKALSLYLGDFLLVKCFFFLALMRPKPGQGTRPDKQRKWLYRRKLFTLGVDEYAKSRTIDTGFFPKLSEFEDTPGKPHP
ncbi:phosphotransferase [Nocardiopsis valliformis]|uniref:phosphotransferase n=1 Tax=Nocardiopsis valliformis TaxID=239974 RepID=UPI000348F87F|nr:phosphotransferase [Nocardiopsis valliformis]